ncbi:MAG: hypothetical protein JAZ17_26425 [Candidatus Thiodiazotropha endolucinida]|nr:hypothetical protein [Candidatus Thiodiazotropha endolucinida]
MLLGEGAGGLSAGTVSRLKASWEADYDRGSLTPITTRAHSLVCSALVRAIPAIRPLRPLTAMESEAKAKGGLGCPVSHPERHDTPVDRG